MGITDTHYQLIRFHFFNILGSKCSQPDCDFNDFSKIHFHHISGNGHILNGENGRGREVRMWNLFEAYKNNDLQLLCPECHSKTDGYKIKKGEL